MNFDTHYRRGGMRRVLLRGTGDLFSKFANGVQTILGVVERELRDWSEYPLPLSHRIRAYRHGFLSQQYKNLGLENKNPEEYMSSKTQARVIWRKIDSGYSDIFKNKVAFHIATAPYIDGVPELYGFTRDGRFEGWNGYEEINDIPSDEVFIKPITGGLGENVSKVKTSELNIENLTDRDYLISEIIKQHEYARNIWPESANTIRILTVQDPDTGEFFIPSASHRFGAAGTGPRDNRHAGGVGAPIVVETGEMGKIRRYSRDTGLEYLETHPDTGAQVNGVSIPQWDEIREFALSLARLHRQRPWAGWDIVLSPEGPVVLEGTKNPGIVTQQYGGGLMADERVRRFINSL